MTAVHESQARVTIAELYDVGRQHTDGSLTIPWDALKAWAERTVSDCCITSYESGRRRGLAECPCGANPGADDLEPSKRTRCRCRKGLLRALYRTPLPRSTLVLLSQEEMVRRIEYARQQSRTAAPSAGRAS